MNGDCFQQVLDKIKHWNKIRNVLRMYGKSEYVWGNSQETATTRLVQGVLYDFGGYLTSRKEEITLSEKHDCSVIVELISDFMKEREIDNTFQPDYQWEGKCIRTQTYAQTPSIEFIEPKNNS